MGQDLLTSKLHSLSNYTILLLAPAAFFDRQTDQRFICHHYIHPNNFSVLVQTRGNSPANPARVCGRMPHEIHEHGIHEHGWPECCSWLVVGCRRNWLRSRNGRRSRCRFKTTESRTTKSIVFQKLLSGLFHGTMTKVRDEIVVKNHDGHSSHRRRDAGYVKSAFSLFSWRIVVSGAEYNM